MARRWCAWYVPVCLWYEARERVFEAILFQFVRWCVWEGIVEAVWKHTGERSAGLDSCRSCHREPEGGLDIARSAEFSLALLFSAVKSEGAAQSSGRP